MMIHDRARASARGIEDLELGSDLDTKLDNLTHLKNLGRAIGQPWKVADIMLWQSSLVSTRVTALY